MARRLAAARDWRLSRRILEAVLPRAAAGYGAAGARIALMTAAIGGLIGRWGSSALGSVSVLYLLVVLPVAVRFGRGPAVFASVAAFLAHNWFHVQPLHTLTVADPQEWVALVLLLVVSAVTGALAAAQRRRAEEARRREREARALHELGRILSASDDVDGALRAVAEHLRAALGLAGCAVLLPDDPLRGGRAVARAVSGAPPPPAARATAAWLVAPARSASAAGPGRRWVRVHPPRPGPARRGASRVAFVPLTAADRTVGVLRLARRPDGPAWAAEDARLVDAAADQIALAVERRRLRREALDGEVLRRTDETRRALLAAVSHDLRTPLASIKAAAESLLQEEVPWTPGERRGFGEAIRAEADRLNRLVENLLAVSRIEAGALRPARELFPVDAVVDDVVGRLARKTAGHRVVVDLPDDLPPVPLDCVLVGQTLANLLENAVKYTPPGGTVAVSARQEGDAVVLAVTDDGPGSRRPPCRASSTRSFESRAGTRRARRAPGWAWRWCGAWPRRTAGRPPWPARPRARSGGHGSPSPCPSARTSRRRRCSARRPQETFEAPPAPRRMRRLLLAAACAAPLLGGVLALPPQPAAALASRPCTQWTSGRFLYTHCQYADGQHVLLVTAPGYWHEYYWFE